MRILENGDDTGLQGSTDVPAMQTVSYTIE